MSLFNLINLFFSFRDLFMAIATKGITSWYCPTYATLTVVWMFLTCLTFVLLFREYNKKEEKK